MALPTRDQIINGLNASLTTFANSLAAYLLETDPYLNDNDKDAMGAVAEIAAADQRFESAVTKLIGELDGIPQIGSVDPQLSEMNYLSFPYLLDVLIEYKKKEIARYRPIPAKVAHYPDVRALFSEILKTHEDHLAKLEGIRKNRYKSAEPGPKETRAEAEKSADAAEASEGGEKAEGEKAEAEAS
jgi:bacterioferritin (cytochrome b1)